MKRLHIFLTIGFFLSTALTLIEGAEKKINESMIKKAMVQIYVTYQRPNYFMPWQMNAQEEKSGSGCVINGNRILTNAHVVSDHTFIQVRRSDDVNRYTATVEFAGHDCDLALLKVENESFYKGIEPLALGDLPQLRDKVSVYGFPIGGNKLAITEGIVSRIEIETYTHSNLDSLIMQIDAVVNSGNSGGPVLKDNRIAGIAFQRASNIGDAIPAPIIKQFLKDIEDGTYDGFPYLGLEYQKLENPYMRQALKMNPDETGVYIVHVEYDNSVWGHVQAGDILMKIKGIPIANDATIPFRTDDRIAFSFPAIVSQIGDKLKLTLKRDGQIIEEEITLKKIRELVRREEYEVTPTYYIYAGLVFVPLTYNYMNSWEEWSSVPLKMRNYYYYGKLSEKRKEVIVLNIILADEVNKGYQNQYYEIVSRVNDQTIGSMRELKKAIEENREKYLKISLENNAQIFLDTESAMKASVDILKKYKITDFCSQDLK